MNESVDDPGAVSGVKKRDMGEGLATASLILGVMAALGFVFVLPPFMFGATAIVLAFLSSGENGIALRGKIGMFMGAISMVLLVFIIASAVHFFLSNPGMFDDYYKEFNELYQEMQNSGSFI